MNKRYGHILKLSTFVFIKTGWMDLHLTKKFMGLIMINCIDITHFYLH